MRVGQLALSLVLGFLGGIAGTLTVLRLHSRDVSTVVRASRFELVGASGSPLAYWGTDAQHGDILISFLDEKGRSRAKLGLMPSRGTGNTTEFAPFTALMGPEGRARVYEGLDVTDRPFLAMGDSQSEGHLLLGHSYRSDAAGDTNDPWDNWSLIFRDPQGAKQYVEIGATTPIDTKQRTGYVLLRNSVDKRFEVQPK